MLNAMQKHILEIILDFIFNPLRDDADIAPSIALVALDSMTNDDLYHAHKDTFSKINVLQLVDQARAICTHRYPQNRPVGSYKIQEPCGLLGLTIYNEDHCPPVTREDVINEITKRINSCKLDIQGRMDQAAIETSYRTAPRVPTEMGLTLATAFAAFVEAVHEHIKEWPGLDPDAANTYSVAFLRAIRKGYVDKLLDNPQDYGILPRLVSFLTTYVQEHPILSNFRTYNADGRDLELRALKHSQQPIPTQAFSTAAAASSSTGAPSTNIYTATNSAIFWKVEAPLEPLNLEEYIHIVLAIHTKLQNHLAMLTGYDKNAAATYLSTALRWYRKNQFEMFLKNSEDYGVPKDFIPFLMNLFHEHPKLQNSDKLDEAERRDIETTLITNLNSLTMRSAKYISCGASSGL